MRGALLINLGTPDAPNPGAVRAYLREFLGDRRVLDLPAPARWLLLNLVILPLRSRRSAEAYRKIWSEQGSPLLAHGQELARKVGEALGPGWQVELAMRYGRPSIASALDALRRRGIDQITVLPLYPHYASATTGSSVEELFRVTGSLWTVPFLRVLEPFYDDAGYLGAFAENARTVLAQARPDHVLFSFHGLPERHLKKGDESGSHCLASEGCCSVVGHANRSCYRAQCFHTARELAARLGLSDGAYSLSFQSRMGKGWIGPHTDQRVRELAGQGKKRLVVLSPAFVADCLETLEEIGIRARAQFKQLGGEELTLVPSLNASPAWVEAVARMIVGGESAAARRSA